MGSGTQHQRKVPQKTIVKQKKKVLAKRKDSSSPDNGPQVGTFGAQDGITYHLLDDAGHSAFIDQPQAMYAFIRDVVLNTNPYDLHT